MSAETESKLLLRALRGEALPRPPIWLMRQAGRYLPEYRAVRQRTRDFLSFCYAPDLAIEVTHQPIRRFGLDAAILFSDILVVPDALGFAVRFIEGEGPKLDPVRRREDLPAIDPERFQRHLAPVLTIVRGLRETLPDAVALIGFAGAPWTLAAYIVEGGGSREYQQAQILAQTQPAFFAELVERLTDAVIWFLDAQARAGAEVLQLFDSWAGVLSASQFETWCVQPARRIVAELALRHPTVPLIWFPRGAGPRYIAAAEVGAAAVSLDQGVPASWARAALTAPSGLCLQGNLDPIALVAGGQRLIDEAARIVDAWSGRAFVFNLGHGILPVTDPENVAALVRYLHSRGGSA
jgi:uroporphyrinogen decarboxylase